MAPERFVEDAARQPCRQHRRNDHGTTNVTSYWKRIAFSINKTKHCEGGNRKDSVVMCSDQKDCRADKQPPLELAVATKRSQEQIACTHHEKEHQGVRPRLLRVTDANLRDGEDQCRKCGRSTIEQIFRQ